MKTIDQNRVDDEWSLVSINMSECIENYRTCSYGLQAPFACINSICQKNPFLCTYINCQCQSAHIGCIRGQIQSLKQIIINKHSFKYTEKLVNAEIQNQILYLSNYMRDLATNYLNKIAKKYQNNYLSSLQKKILSAFQTGDTNQICGKMLSQICQNQLIQTKIQKFISKFNDKIKGLTTQLFSDIRNQGKNRIKLQKNKKLKICPRTVAYTANFKFDQGQLLRKRLLVRQINLNQINIKSSSIISTIQNYIKLIKILPKKISNLSLLFKASEHNFDIKRYYQICGSQTHTIILCKTSKEKIIGGYTPLRFSPQPNQIPNGFVTDHSNSSFVFSLTENQKFQLKNKNKAIYRAPSLNCIDFGGTYFCICDNANTNHNSWLKFSNQHYHSHNRKDDFQSNLNINGNQNYKFAVKQWEVIKVQFRSQ